MHVHFCMFEVVHVSSEVYSSKYKGSFTLSVLQLFKKMRSLPCEATLIEDSEGNMREGNIREEKKGEALD